MSSVIQFPGAKKRRQRSGSKTQGSTLCKNGHHKWKVDKESRFDVKQGKLVTVKRCQRCGKTRVGTD